MRSPLVIAHLHARTHPRLPTQAAVRPRTPTPAAALSRPRSCSHTTAAAAHAAPTAAFEATHAFPRLTRPTRLAALVFMMLKQVYVREGPARAKCVQRLDDSQVVQIALRFAFRCVLHRCESPEIRC